MSRTRTRWCRSVVPARSQHAGQARALLRAGALAGILSVISGRGLEADFGEPVLVTEGATGCSLEIDGANNVYVISIVDGRLVINLIGPNLRESLPLPQVDGVQGAPTGASSCCGETFVAIEQGDPDSSEIGREIFMTSNGGGRFARYANLSRNAFDDHSPKMAIDILGFPHLVWTQVDPKAKPVVVHYNHSGGSRRFVGFGEEPAIAVDEERVAHVVYTRRNDKGEVDVYYSSNPTGEFETEEKVVNTPSEAESNPNIVVNERGDLFITYEAGGSLRFVTRPKGEGFGIPRVLDTGVSDSRLTIREGSLLTIVYSKGGEIYYIQGLSSFLLEPARLGDGSAGERTCPHLAADLDGNLHACFIEDGNVYYTNNAGEVQADFSAEPRVGEAPLTVQFQDLSSGDVAVWRWDFGDGESSQSNARNPVHTYETPGKYTVSLTVFNADRESTTVKEDFIVVQEPFNTLEIPDVSVVPNLQNVWFPVYATHPEPIRGFQIMAVHDPGILEFDRCTLDHTATKLAEPQFVQCNHFDDGRLEIGVLLELEPPFEGTTIPPGQNQTIMNLIFNVASGAPEGTVTEVKLLNDSDISRIFNIFTVDGFSRFPSLESSTVDVRFVFPLPPKFFLRGDVDSNGSIDITDAVKLLNFLFLGGPQPECMDGADVTDSGSVDISGAISILNFLFLGGAAPRVPYPHLGIDPTEDDLPPCQ